MQHLLAAWNEIEPKIRESYLLLFLDYDGTLSPIAEHPKLARLGEPVKNLLAALAAGGQAKVIIMSGRLLEDLKQIVGVPGLIYVGNHGFELEGPALRHVHPGASEAEKLMREILKQLEYVFASFPGIFLENKVFTLSVHYRSVREEKIELAKRIFRDVLRPYADPLWVRITEGKKVWEVRPGVPWNKGTTLLWLLSRVLTGRSAVFPVYIGDDKTDEDAFKVIKGKGIGVKVMEAENEPTLADYYLKSTGEVFDFLKRTAKIKAADFSEITGTIPGFA